MLMRVAIVYLFLQRYSSSLYSYNHNVFISLLADIYPNSVLLENSTVPMHLPGHVHMVPTCTNSSRAVLGHRTWLSLTFLGKHKLFPKYESVAYKFSHGFILCVHHVLSILDVKM